MTYKCIDLKWKCYQQLRINAYIVYRSSVVKFKPSPLFSCRNLNNQMSPTWYLQFTEHRFYIAPSPTLCISSKFTYVFAFQNCRNLFNRTTQLLLYADLRGACISCWETSDRKPVLTSTEKHFHYMVILRNIKYTSTELDVSLHTYWILLLRITANGE